MAQETAQPELPQQAGKLLTQVAGYLGTQAMAIGLRFGLFEELAKHPDGLTSDALAKAKGTNSLYTQVWCRSAYAAEVLDVDEGGAFRLAPHMETLLLDEDHPAYAGALPQIFSQPELGELFEENFTSGKRIWWDDVSPAFIQAVSGTARPFYTRLIAGGLAKVPGLSERLADGGRVMDLACGAGIGLVKLARALPNVSLVGVDGDAHSLGLVKERLAGEGLEDRVTLVQSTLEELDHSDEYDAVIINVSMHECRDIDKVTQNVHRAL
ncbi:MAG: class I SAM-dependent methyltransferase, partial [Chloroflexi bacterium]|nr:class I SAM-dependent methyltransferase [Chloroflexota bacterium]